MTDRGLKRLKGPLRQVQKEIGSLLGLLERHYGPGPHPGTGTSQDVHGGEGSKLFVNDPRFPRPAGWTLEGLKKEKKRLVNYMAATYPAAPGVTAASWMAPDGTIYDVGRGGHQSSAINAFTKSGLWSENQARASYHLGFHGPNEFVEYGFVRMYALNDANEFGFEMSSPDELTDAQRERLAIEALKAYANGWRVVAGHSDRRLDLRRRYSEEDIRNLLGIVERHYGPGPHPGTGTPQDVHGDGVGLGEFTFGHISSRNKIRFNISMQDALRRGLNKGEVNLLGVEYHQELIRAMQNIESAIGFPIEGLVISNDLMDLAVAVYGEQVLDDPLYRESTFGKLREEAIGWRGGNSKRTVWLDEAINTIIGPRKMSDSVWHETVWHEIGHHYTDEDGWAGFSYEFMEMMEAGDPQLDLSPSTGWLEWAHQHYGYDPDTILGEYRADLFASWVGFNLSDRRYDTPIWRRRFTGLQGPLAPEDVKNMENLMSVVMDEGKKKASLVERQVDEKVLVFFPNVGEVLAISISSLDKLPVQAIILAQIFAE